MIAVVGSGNASRISESLALEVGRLIAIRGAILLSGGLSGVMEYSAKGAYDAGGVTIGILPGDRKGGANRFIKYPIVTGVGHSRNMIIAHTADGIIAINGSFGTVSEVAIGLKIGKPVVLLGSLECSFTDIVRAANPEDAVDILFSKL